MKYVLKVTCIILALFSSSVHALNVVEGWYGGLILGGSYSPYKYFNYSNPFAPVDDPDNPPDIFTGKLTYSGFGNIGGLFGYRFPSGLRLELEADYSYVPYKRLTLETENFNEPTVAGENAFIVIRTPSHSTAIRMRGSTSSGLVFINGFYEFIQNGCENNWAPYVGLGLGIGYINNSAKLFDNEVDVEFGNASVNSTTPIGQIIAGINYFMDDFTAVGFDFRYMTTARKVQYATPTYPEMPAEYLIPPDGDPNLEIIQRFMIPFSARMEIYSFNITFTGAFNCL